MTKMKVPSLAELVRVTERAGISLRRYRSDRYVWLTHLYYATD
jgi:hypothetical protein